VKNYKMKPLLKIKDQTGRDLYLKNKPERIISLVPSITYSTYSLNLEKEVVGITRFCKYPKEWKKQKTIIGGTKDIKIEKIIDLKPDLILTNKEENTKEIVEQLEKITSIYVSDVKDIETNNTFLKNLGIITKKVNEAEKINTEIKQLIVKNQNIISKTFKTLYFIWREPWMVAGTDTYINEMMRLNGFQNIINQKRYPVIDLKKIQNNSPEIIFLSSEPYPFKEKHRQELKSYFPNTKIILVDGEPFTWFGSYTVQGLTYLQKLYKNIKTDAY